ncbi:aspartyl protease family protein [Thalassomonas haliotis]|uniref:Aspartyl protease family protein n=1 Tax=Thalassomonas haliotis TaxID=485448 RepID=A0ABY7VL98_9GAMM|nr:aspartyl protease family protein [Thalassomonas haliotis]WDE14019.1 aspartyl protease family protein [Thalassomonas haliotis]
MFKKILINLAAVIAFSLSLGGCDTLNSIRMMQINSDAEPVWTGKERIKLKSVFLAEKPYVYATVDGEELLFLLDTGASFFILMDTPKVQKLGLNRDFDLSLGGWGEQEDSKAFKTDIGRIDLGGVHFNKMKAAVIPVSKSHYYLRDDEAIDDGVIGHDIMKHFTWEIDAANNEIYISQAKYQPEANARYFELHEFFNKISIKGDLAFNQEDVAEDAEFIIDTGSRHYAKLSAAYPENNEIKIASSRVRAADFGLSGKVEHDRVILPSLKLGGINIDKVKVNLIPGDDEDDWWVLGNALMNQFKTVIDYKHQAFYLVPQQKFVTDHNLFGLELRKIRSGEFVIRYVFPQLPASKLDLEVGDLVTKINSKNSSDISLSQYNDIASEIGTHQICIQRQNQCFTIEAKHIEGYSNL